MASVRNPFLRALLAAASAAASIQAAVYRLDPVSPPRPSTVRELSTIRTGAWLRLDATKADGSRFTVWLQSDGPPTRTNIHRYIVQEGESQPREYRHAVTGDAVLPSIGGWDHLMPREADGGVRYLGHLYRPVPEQRPEPAAPPANAKLVQLRPDLLVGPPSNTRQKDETRRYDDTDYELIRLTRGDYRLMAASGVTTVRVDAEQSVWADELGLFYWGPLKSLPYPELLYRSQYLGPARFLDEPAVGTRDHVIRPRLAKDPAYRRSITPQLALESFKEHFDKALQAAPWVLMRELGARPDVDLGSMRFPQENLYSWETMPATAAYQLSRDPLVPAAMMFEPPGRIGTRRSVPEINMTYGTHFRADDPRVLPAVIFGFLRGAARLTGKGWGVSIYGAVDRADSFWWLTHAYDLGATQFSFWDNYRLACVPFGEVLALSRHLSGHAANNPRRNLARLRHAGEVAIVLPAGYNLGHVQIGKGSLWGVDELNLERKNRHGVKYRTVMSNLFAEVERHLRMGVSFDLLWDLEGRAPDGYREVIRIREDDAVPRTSPNPEGAPPKLELSIDTRGLEIVATARVTETAAPVFYTFGADRKGVYQNAAVAWEIYGPQEEDRRFVVPDGLAPNVRWADGVADVETRIRVDKPGNYRLRAATVDMAGRTTVEWRDIMIR